MSWALWVPSWSSELAKAMRVDAQRGAFVSPVDAELFRSESGIKAGDAVYLPETAEPISSFAALRALVEYDAGWQQNHPGLLRDGEAGHRELRIAAEQPDSG